MSPTLSPLHLLLLLLYIEPVYMIMEYMCHGDLLGFLRATRGHPDMYTVFPGTKNLPTNVKLRSRDLLRIISQVASGMNFLSSLKVWKREREGEREDSNIIISYIVHIHVLTYIHPFILSLSLDSTWCTLC